MLTPVILHRTGFRLKNVIVGIIYDVDGKRFFSQFGPVVRKVAHHCCGLRQAVGRGATSQNCGKVEEVRIVLSQ